MVKNCVKLEHESHTHVIRRMKGGCELRYIDEDDAIDDELYDWYENAWEEYAEENGIEESFVTSHRN
jgi:hypothetical protein